MHNTCKPSWNCQSMVALYINRFSVVTAVILDAHWQVNSLLFVNTPCSRNSQRPAAICILICTSLCINRKFPAKLHKLCLIIASCCSIRRLSRKHVWINFYFQQAAQLFYSIHICHDWAKTFDMYLLPCRNDTIGCLKSSRVYIFLFSRQSVNT